MLEVARSKSNAASIVWRQADATDLPFEARSFDAVVCQFGWMFFPDKALAMREARRVLIPGGRLFYDVWDRIENCPVYQEANNAVHELFPVDPPLFYEAPFTMYDERQNRKFMNDAGFQDISVELVSHQGARMTPDRMAEGVVRGSPIVPEIQARNGNVGETITYIAKRLEGRFGSRPFTSPMKALFCEATAPS